MAKKTKAAGARPSRKKAAAQATTKRAAAKTKSTKARTAARQAAGPKSDAGGESLEDRKARVKKILPALRQAYPKADCALDHTSALELLVATILAAQCTDERVNIVTKDLFAQYKSADDYATAKPETFEAEIRSTGFFRQKTKSILAASQTLVDKHDGQVPDTMEALLELPGVARKTANVILGTWFGKNEGIVVDTHVGRLAHRLGLTWTSRDSKDALKIENDLMQVFPRQSWTYVAHALVWHGRKVCRARKPDCQACTLSAWCPSAFVV